MTCQRCSFNSRRSSSMKRSRLGLRIDGAAATGSGAGLDCAAGAVAGSGTMGFAGSGSGSATGSGRDSAAVGGGAGSVGSGVGLVSAAGVGSVAGLATGAGVLSTGGGGVSPGPQATSRAKAASWTGNNLTWQNSPSPAYKARPIRLAKRINPESRFAWAAAGTAFRRTHVGSTASGRTSTTAVS